MGSIYSYELFLYFSGKVSKSRLNLNRDIMTCLKLFIETYSLFMSSPALVMLYSICPNLKLIEIPFVLTYPGKQINSFAEDLFSTKFAVLGLR